MFTIKKIVLTVLLVSFVFCFVGCSASDLQKYESMVFDCYNDGHTVNIEATVWKNEKFQKKDMPDQTCTFGGKSYTGTYQYSDIRKGNSYVIDIYEGEDRIEFGLKSETGELVYINLVGREFLDTQPYLEDVSNPYENAISIAKKVADEYIDNIEEYTMEVGKPYVYQKVQDGVTYQLTRYGINFTKYIQGHRSSDSIQIGVTSKGTISGVVMYDVGAFDGMEIDFDEQLVAQSIAQKVEEIYRKISYKVTEHTAEEQRIVLAPDGTLYMLSAVYVKGMLENSDSDKAETTGFYLLTVIGER